MILNNTMISIKKKIEKDGFFRLTAMADDKTTKALNRMLKKGMIAARKQDDPSFIDFIKNWK